MIQTSRMYWYVFSPLCLFLISTGCSATRSGIEKQNRTVQSNKDTPANPVNQNPGWAFDAPAYMRPAAEPPAEAQAKPSDPLHFFTRERIVSIRRPGNYTPEEAPRVAIYWTDNNGFRWNKAGYFGREQSFFPFHVEEDGDYGVRFVGPGQEPAKEAPAFPERVYHVDTSAPEVEVSIEPEQTWYTPGQSVTVAWQVKDYHLIEKPVTVYMMVDHAKADPKPVELQRDLGNEGTYSYEIPMETLDHEIRFRVEALDRAANLGMGTSFALQVVHDLPSEESGEDLIAKKPEADPTDWSNVPRKNTKFEENKSAPIYSTQVVRSGREQPAAVPEVLIDEAATAETPKASRAEKSAEPAQASSRSRGSDSVAMNLDSQLTLPEPPRSRRLSLESLATSVLNSEPPLETMLLRGSLSQSESEEASEETSPSLDNPDEDTPVLAKVDASDEPAPSLAETLLADSHGRLDPLVVPLPATLDASEFDSRWNIAHPWRLLGNIVASSRRYVWTLPQLDDERLERMYEDRDAEGEIPPLSKLPTAPEVLVGEPGETPDPPNLP